MKWVKIQLDTDGDENRAVKYADMELFVDIDGENSRFLATHVPTLTASDPEQYYASPHDGGWTVEDAKRWALADCIRKVLG